jgi:hypothetical protein
MRITRFLLRRREVSVQESIWDGVGDMFQQKKKRKNPAKRPTMNARCKAVLNTISGHMN